MILLLPLLLPPHPPPPTLVLLLLLQKVAHPLHMAAWRTNVNELQEQLNKPGADANKRDKVSVAVQRAVPKGKL